MTERKRKNLSRFVGLFGLLLIVSGIITAYRELLPYFVTGATIEQKTAAVLSGQFTPGPSFESKFLVLSDCAVVIYNTPETGNVDQSALKKCFEISRNVTSETPASSQAWLVQAQAADRLDDVPALLNALKMTHLSAPTEEWILLDSARLAEVRYQFLSPDLRATHDLDLTVLASTKDGLNWLVKLYQAVPDTRPRVISAIESLPTWRQEEFLSQVKALASNAQPILRPGS